MLRQILSAIVLASLLGGKAGAADPTPIPSPAPLPSVPPDVSTNPYVKLGTQILDGYLKRQRDVNTNGSRGTVTYFRRFDLQIQSGTNAYRQVHLHQGTVINPRGTTLANGMTVEVSGQGQPDGSLNADTITVVH